MNENLPGWISLVLGGFDMLSALGFGGKAHRHWIGAPKRTWIKTQKEFNPMFHGMQFSKTTSELKPKIEERAAKCEAEVEEWKKREASGDGLLAPHDKAAAVAKAQQAQKALLENAATLRMIARNLTATSYLLSLDELEYLGF